MRFDAPRNWNWLLLLLPALLSFGSEAHESQTCVATLREFRAMLGGPTFPLIWEETTMGDGKPLVVSILERNGLFSMEFIKSTEGLWLESAGLVCKAGADFEIRFAANQVRLGPAAGLALRFALRDGGSFTLSKLGSAQLRIATTGWNGTFAPRELVPSR